MTKLGFGSLISLFFCFLFIGTTIRWTTTTIEILVFISLMFYYWRSKKDGFVLTICKEQKKFLYVLIFLLFSYLLTFVLGRGWELESIKRPGYPSLTDLDIPTRYFLGIFVVALFLKLKFQINKKYVMYSIGIGGIINGCVALYERYFLHMNRVDGWVGIAEMGTASSILCLLCSIFFIFSTSKKEQMFFLISSLFAFSSSFSTAARSAMISLVIAFCILQIIFLLKNKEYFKKALIPMGGMLVVFSLLWTFPVGQDTFRLRQIQVDIDQYAKDNPQTSIGMRFEMWKEALTMFEMSPIYGMSTAMIAKNTNEIIQKSGSRIRSKNDLGVRGTKHSQIMEALAKRGIIGLFALLLFWWSSLRMFGQKLMQCHGEALEFRICGFLVIFYFIFINSFTGEPWDSMVDTPMIILLCSLFLKLINQDDYDKENLCNNPS